MPDKQENDTFSRAGQAANWFVGLSGAAVGGGLAKIELIERFPGSGKVAFVLGAFLFLWSIVSGIFYIFQLLPASQEKEKFDREDAKNPRDEAAWKAAKEAREAAGKKIKGYHYATLVSFVLACLATLACLICVLVWGLAPEEKPATQASAAAAPAPPNRFTLVTVPVHQNGRLLHDHTFLLDQLTGDAWLMECQPGKSVEFRRVRWLRLDGTFEPEVSPGTGTPAPAKLAGPSRP
jgi:hypothetical protein